MSMCSQPNTWIVLTAPRPRNDSPADSSQPPPLPCSGPVDNSHIWLNLTAAPHTPAPLFSQPRISHLTLDERNKEAIKQILDQLDGLETARRRKRTQRVADWVCGLPDFAPPPSLPTSRTSHSDGSSMPASSSTANSSSRPLPSSVSLAPSTSSGSWNLCSYAPTEGDDGENSVGGSEAGEEEGKMKSQMRGRFPFKETYRPLRLRSVPLEPPRSRAGRGL